MSGRHRKPTTSSIGVAKIAVTGAVIGGGSLGLAVQAQAATDSEWDVVASCESSGNWAINTGNGYQGGLQFSPSTWLGYGGGQYASAANMASREEQIVIAEKVLAGQGRGAWPTCGRGLSGPTQREITVTEVDFHTEVPATPADTPVDSPAPAAGQDSPVIPEELPAPAPQDVPAPADAVPAPQDLPAPAPQDAVPAPAPQDLPTPAPAPQDAAQAPQDAAPAPQDLPAPAPAPAPQDPTAPELQIISIADTTDGTDEIVIAEAVAPAPAATIVQAGMIAPAPLAPADPAVPPVVPTTAVPVPAAPADPAAVVVPAAAPAAPAPAPAPAPDGTVVVAAAPAADGVPHLPSPDSPPPGTSTDPGQAGNPNVSYIKDLWHALQNQEIDRNDLLLALAQRSFTGEIPLDAGTPAQAPAPVPADPAAPPAG